MNTIKKYIIPIGYAFIILLILTVILTVLNYFDLLSLKTYNALKTLIPGISLFTGALILGKRINEKGYIAGIKLGGIIIFLLLIFKTIFYSNTFNLSIIIYYIILLLSSMLGAMIGINIKKKEKYIKPN